MADYQSHMPRPTVWAVSQETPQQQRRGRYTRASSDHPGKMVPELALRIVEQFSPAHGLVVDPMCGIGTTLMEGSAAGRCCIGVELEPRWAEVARANLALGGLAADVRVGDATRLTDALPDVIGRADLVVTSPPYGCAVAKIDMDAWGTRGQMATPDTFNYSTDATNLGHLAGDQLLAHLRRVWDGCWAVLRPRGVLVTVTKNTRRQGRLFDLAAGTVAAAEGAGFAFEAHVVALLCAVRSGGLLARPSYWQRRAALSAHARGVPSHLIAHEDVLVFRKVAR